MRPRLQSIHRRTETNRGCTDEKLVISATEKTGPLVPALLLAAVIVTVPGFSSAADPEAGAELAAPCLSCHPADDFLGESEAELLELIEDALADSGHPPDNRPLSETDLADIAAFFARGE